MGPQRRDADKKALRNNNLPRAQPPGESCAPRACIFHERARVSWPHFASSFRRAARSHHDARRPSLPHQQPRLTRDSTLSSRSRGCGGGHVDGKFKRRLAVECLVIRARAGRHNGVEGGDIAFARFSRTWPWQHRAHDGSLDTQRQRARQPRPRPRQRRRAPSCALPQLSPLGLQRRCSVPPASGGPLLRRHLGMVSAAFSCTVVQAGHALTFPKRSDTPCAAILRGRPA